MDREEQTRYGVVLEAAAAELRRFLAADHESIQPVAPDRAIGRLSRVGAMQAQQMSLDGRRRQQERLRRIEHALELVGQGTYGSCTRCGEDIGRARLDAIPDTFVCVVCVERLRSRGAGRTPEPS
jgi:DnaK suppressor protein